MTDLDIYRHFLTLARERRRCCTVILSLDSEKSSGTDGRLQRRVSRLARVEEALGNDGKLVGEVNCVRLYFPFLLTPPGWRHGEHEILEVE